MRLTVVGFSHKSAGPELRERLARLEPRFLYESLRAGGFREAVILSTCNRFEVYAAGGEGSGSGSILSLLAQAVDAPLAEEGYAREAPDAASVPFEAAAGLDSLVVGETEILGQVRAAYEDARKAGMTGKFSNVLFQRALFAGKKVRSETSIASGQTSAASVAVQLAERIFGGLSGSSVLILGAGQMAELTARHLLAKKAARILIANRTWERAQALASSLAGAVAVPWQLFPESLDRADIVISSTGSDRPVLTRDMVAAALPHRGGRSLFVIDIAMPRDVEEEVHGLEHVYLYRLEDLEAIVAENLKTRGAELQTARAMVGALSSQFSNWDQSVANGAEQSLKHRPRFARPPEVEAAG
jgi:glutamyl-tRNA reductase